MFGVSTVPNSDKKLMDIRLLISVPSKSFLVIKKQKFRQRRRNLYRGGDGFILRFFQHSKKFINVDIPLQDYRNCINSGGSERGRPLKTLAMRGVDNNPFHPPREFPLTAYKVKEL